MCGTDYSSPREEKKLAREACCNNPYSSPIFLLSYYNVIIKVSELNDFQRSLKPLLSQNILYIQFIICSLPLDNSKNMSYINSKEDTWFVHPSTQNSAWHIAGNINKYLLMVHYSITLTEGSI